MKETVLLKAGDGQFYKRGHVYSKIVRVKNEFVEEWTLVSIEEAKADRKALVFKQALHLNKKD